MIREISLSEARTRFYQLPKYQQLATLSPDYVAIDAQRDKALKPVFLATDDWLHFGHRGCVPGSDFCDFQSAYGYGGPIGPKSAHADYLEWCADNHILAEFVRFHPLSYQEYYGKVRLNRKTVVVPVGSKFTDTCRNKISKAIRSGVEVVTTSSQHIKNFAVNYREGLKRLKADPFYFFNDAYFDAMSSWEKAHLLVAEIDGLFVSAGIFLEGGDTLEYHLSTTDQRGRETGANNLLLARALDYAEQLGLKQLYLGGGKTDFPDDPLLDFKKSFGGGLVDFYVGEAIHHPETYYAMMAQAFDVPPTNNKVLWWR